jgi:hypothetical protein
MEGIARPQTFVLVVFSASYNFSLACALLLHHHDDHL